MRPSAAQLLEHPFIRQAPPQSILADNVRQAMAELESKHEALDEISGLMHNTSVAQPASAGSKGTISRKSMRGASSTRESGSPSGSALGGSADADDFDDDFMSELGATGGAGFSSDTMRMQNVGGTMIAAGSNNKTMLDSSAHMGATMVMAPGATNVSLSDTTVSAISRSGGSKNSAASALSSPLAPASAAAASPPHAHLIHHDSDGISLEHFADDEDESLGEMAIAHDE